MAYLDEDALSRLGLEAYGDNVLISAKASIYGADRIRLASNVRIDDFCILSAGEGGIEVGSFVHIAAYTSIIGAGRVTIADFANLSSRVSVYSSSDDYSGETMTNPMVADELKNVDSRPVQIGRHVIVGCGSVILPGATLQDGVAIGALSLVKDDCEAFTIHAGNPARMVGERSRRLLELERGCTGDA
jgi:galactoside O-acetyltransferase